LAASIWPRARIVGFEPNAHERDALERLTRELPHFSYHMCFLGPQRKVAVAYSDRGRITSLLAPENVMGGARAEAPMDSLDAMIDRGDVRPPDFIKIDVQGYELEVLRGAPRALAGCTAALLECSLLRLFDGAPRIDEVIDFLRERQMIWYDVAGIVRRPNDDALWQLDLIFLREGQALLEPQAH
jgi:FkbM family methyltransferase